MGLTADVLPIKELTKLVSSTVHIVPTDGIIGDQQPSVCSTFQIRPRHNPEISQRHSDVQETLWAWKHFQRTLKRPFRRKKKEWVENVQQIRIIRPIYTDGLFCLLCTLINGGHCFIPLPGCSKTASAVLAFYLFPALYFSLPYFMSHLPGVQPLLQRILSLTGLFLFFDKWFILFY